MIEPTSNKIAHLEMIMELYKTIVESSQNVKQWAISLITVFLALSTQENGTIISRISFFPILLFWIIEARCLFREKLILAHYNQVRMLNESEIDFNLDYYKHQDKIGHWVQYLVDRGVLSFNASLIAGVILLDWLIK